LRKSDQAVMQIQSLVKYLSRRGVLSMLVVANHGLLGHNVTSDIGREEAARAARPQRSRTADHAGGRVGAVVQPAATRAKRPNIE
jgi:hypothetical protein